MNSVGSDFAKFIKSFPVQTDHNAKEVIGTISKFTEISDLFNVEYFH